MNFKKYIGKIQGKIKEEESNQKSAIRRTGCDVRLATGTAVPWRTCSAPLRRPRPRGPARRALADNRPES